MNVLKKSATTVSIALLVIMTVFAGQSHAGYPAVCEISFRDMVTDKVEKIEAQRDVPVGVDVWQIFDSCQRFADTQASIIGNAKVVKVKAYFP